MRIRRFSEARGIFEEEVSFEPQIHCFGGGGGGGGSDGTDDGDVGTAGSGGGVAPGGQASDSSGNFGGGDGGSDQQDRQAYSDRFGGVSTRNFNVDKNQGFVDTDKGRVYGASDVLGKGIAEGDITPTDRQATAIDMASQITGIDPSNIAVGGDLFFGEEDVIANQDLSFASPDFSAKAPGVTAVPGFAPPDFASLSTVDVEDVDAIKAAQARNALSGATDITSGEQTGTRDLSTTIDPSNQLDPFGEGFLSPEEVAALDAEIAAKNAEIDALNARFAALSTPAPSVGPGQTVSSAEMQSRIASAGSAGTRPSTVQGQSVLSVGLGPNKQEFTFDNTVPGDQRTYTQISGPSIGGVTGALDIDVFDEQPADITITGGQPAFSFSRDVLGVDQSIPQMSLAPESRPSQFDRQARMGEVQGPMSMAPVDQTRFSGIDMMRQADDVLAERAIDEAVFGDTSGIPSPTLRAGAEIVNALESTFGGNQARKIADVANRPGGALVRDPRSGEVLGAVGPEENISSVFMGAQDAVYVGDPRGYEQGVNVGTSILGPDTNVRAVPTQDPFGGGMEGEPGVDYSRPPEAQRDGGDGRQPPQVVPPDPETNVCPVGYAPDGNGNCVYQGRDVVGATPYTPMGPVNISYTGLPSLAPRTLRPTSPNLDFLTRSQTAQPGTRYPDLQPIAPGGDFGLPPSVRTQAPGPSGPVNIPTYGDIRDARQFSRPQGIAGLTKPGLQPRPQVFAWRTKP